MLVVYGAAAVAVLPLPPALHRPLSGAAVNPTCSFPLLSVPTSRRGLSVISSSRRRTTAVVDNDEEGDDDDGEVESMPLKEMRRWLEKKPAGFGEGRTYDTSVEERLLEEMERSRKAQLASKLNTEPGAKPKQQEPRKKDEIDVATGIRVRVSNLPRKKNIHRDLQLAFKGFPGIKNISPAVTGNHKTRDPICKGFAFIDLESEAVAKRFIQMYSKKNVVFGKVQKQITCCLINVSSLSSDPEQSSDGNWTESEQKLVDTEDAMVASIDVNDLSWNPQERTFDGSISTTVDEIEEEINTQELNSFLLNDVENGSLMEKDNSDIMESLASSQKQEKIGLRKRRIKPKPRKSSKLSVPAAMVRLKVRERAVLNGVFSKYGGQVTSPYKDG